MTATAQHPSIFSKGRIGLTYLWRHRCMLRLDDAQTFTALVQRRKLHDRDPRLPLLADKVAVKTHVADVLGPEWVTPTLWHGDVMPDDAPWSVPYVVKARHGCRQTIFVDPRLDDYRAVRDRAHRWLSTRYGYWLDEWLYAQIPRGLLVEPNIAPWRPLPIDYKIYVFGGQAEYVQVHMGRGIRHRWIIFDRNWRRVSAATADPDPPQPRALTAMIDAAECLARDIDFVRVDLYDTDTGPRFGEMTFYPGSGLDRFNPVSLDVAMGKLWLRARGQDATSRPQLTPDGAMLPATG